MTGSSEAAWTSSAWSEAKAIREKILAHPFVASLADGSLPREAFLFYIGQDSLYLDDFGKVLAGLAPGAPTPEDALALAGFSAQAVEVERELHRSFLKGSPPLAISPTCELYTSYLYKRLVRGPWAVALAATLPCFWIYQEVGDRVLELSPRDSANPYQPWIDTYGGEEYAACVASAKAMADRAAEAATAEVRAKMTEAFLSASKMEWMFWDGAYRLERWPL
jgi:thiaminase/transcriptional activator TenA